MTTLDDAALEGVSEILRSLLPADQGFVLVTFPVHGIGPMQGTRSTNHRPAITVRRLREAADNIEKKANTT